MASVLDSIEPAIREAAKLAKIKAPSDGPDAIAEKDRLMLLSLNGKAAEWYSLTKRVPNCTGSCDDARYVGRFVKNLDQVVRFYNTVDTWAALLLVEGTKVQPFAPTQSVKSWDDWAGWGRPDLAKELDELAAIRSWIDALSALPYAPSQAIIAAVVAKLAVLAASLREKWVIWRSGYTLPVFTDDVPYTVLRWAKPNAPTPPKTPAPETSTTSWSDMLSAAWDWLKSKLTPDTAAAAAKGLQGPTPEQVEEVKTNVASKSQAAAAKVDQVASGTESPTPPLPKPTTGGAGVLIALIGGVASLFLITRRTK